MIDTYLSQYVSESANRPSGENLSISVQDTQTANNKQQTVNYHQGEEIHSQSENSIVEKFIAHGYYEPLHDKTRGPMVL